MKKIYKRPYVNIEYFALTQSIAYGCEHTPSVPGGNDLGRVNHWGKATCGWQMGDTSFWPDGNPGCTLKIHADTDVEGVCYNNPSSGNNIFAS